MFLGVLSQQEMTVGKWALLEKAWGYGARGNGP